MAPTTTAVFPGLATAQRASVERARGVTATSPAGGATYGVSYYLKSALAGGICCSITHGAVVPIDVVKTKVQTDPTYASTGLVGGFRRVVATQGAGALLTGLGATAAGYFVQGWFKFGGVEFFKIQFAQSLGERKAWDNRTAIYLASSAMAEFIADLFLCPLEAVRIRSVADKTFPQSLGGGFAQLAKTEGIMGFYAGLGPILLKQIPYTMAKFAVQGRAAEGIYASLGSSPDKMSSAQNVQVSLASGVIAGASAAVISQPADTLLSKVNKPGAKEFGNTVTERLVNIAKSIGFVKLATQGLFARSVMVSLLTAFQFGIFDTVLLTVGAQKFHFHNPDDKSGKH